MNVYSRSNPDEFLNKIQAAVWIRLTANQRAKAKILGLQKTSGMTILKRLCEVWGTDSDFKNFALLVKAHFYH